MQQGQLRRSSLSVTILRHRRVFAGLLWCSYALFLCWIHHHSMVRVSSCSWVGRRHPNSPSQPALGTSSPASTVRYRARVAYNGFRYQGFQLQPSREKHGKQPQPQQHRSLVVPTTIQGELERVLNQRFSIQSGKFVPDADDDDDDYPRIIKVVAAGRTDAGVHARGQAVHFDVPAVVPQPLLLSLSSTTSNQRSLWNNATTILDNDEKVLHHLNKKLPPDIRVWNLQRVPGPVTKEVPIDDEPDVMRGDAKNAGDSGEMIATSTTTNTRTYLWNAMYECTRKLYSYRLALGPVMPPTERHSRWHYPCHHNHGIDPERLRRVLKHFEGTHNFAAFASAVERTERKLDVENNSTGESTVLNTIRHVYSVDLVQEDAEWGFYRVDVCLKGALYKQVRNMVGTALVVAAEAAYREKGNRSPRTTMTEADLLVLLRNNPENGGGLRLQRQHNKCRPAPPEGLTLEHVYFDNDPGF